ncbi:putative O-glycosylation ligase, exosortase A system-associated [Methylotuvimicrobium alcaliphilum]|uniref:O-glycosylation ligase, exosortase A system-associated n=1 Tax=Methylotuvimicrobium alcaliphilum (strain DSM 19304 / NCIMB 14124 / VKM B-2133 / 20Z) TaxID=1091494 RepID=G4SYV6_META2|nr:putative O-glycosylation ligase, exosortase A system-associated [Methylotuvimicrobium alcaliphilum]CCE24403.1 conserved membrane protein of unknown function [Methylotuvimicrobium alcaliphilum 20Z]
MRDLVTAIIIFSSFPFTLKHTYIGVLVWSWIGYMNPHRLGWGFARDFPFAYLVAIVTLVSFLFNKEKKTFPKYGIVYVWFMFLGWMGLTTITAISTDISLIQLEKVAKIQLFIVLTMLMFADLERLTKLIWVIALSLCYFGVKGGLFTISHGGSFIVWGPPGTFIEGNNELALAILMVIPFMNYLRFINQNKWIKQGLIVAMVLMAASSLGSQSRGALLAASAMLLLFWWKSKSKIITGIFAVILAITLISFMPDTWHNRMGTIETYQEDTSAMGRINAWIASYNLAKDRFMGAGFNGILIGPVFHQYAPENSKKLVAHSIYFQVLGDHGFVGLFLFLLLGFLTWTTGSKTIKRTRGIKELENLNMLARMTQVSLLAYATGGAFLSLPYFDLYYHLVVITILCRYLADQHKAKSLSQENMKKRQLYINNPS